jgi:outer membrane protein W
MRRLPVAGLFAVVLLATPSLAHAQQSLNLSFGGFVPRGEDARVRDGGRSSDVLVNNLDFLAFDLKDFNGVTANAEYLVGLGEHLDAGLGVGLYRRTVPSVYADFVNVNGAEIQQDLRLRIVPFTATVRFLPFGRSAAFHPYLGAGLGVFNWRYSESGEFVDFSDRSIYRDSFVGSGTATGPVVLGGVSIPTSLFDIGGEVRYQNATGDLPRAEDFSADKVDLGGWTYLATFRIRF